MPRNSHYVGKAAEAAVASELLCRDIPVYVPLVDTGVDLIAGESIRIQVKSARVSKSGHYLFKLGHCGRLKKSDTKWVHRMRHWPTRVEFLVFWASDIDKFWVVPSMEFETHLPQCVVLGGPRSRKRVDQDKIMSLHNAGVTNADICRQLDLSHTCVYERIHGLLKNTRHEFDFSKYENAWHEIESAVNLARQVNDVDSRYGAMEFEAIKQELQHEKETS